MMTERAAPSFILLGATILVGLVIGLLSTGPLWMLLGTVVMTAVGALALNYPYEALIAVVVLVPFEVGKMVGDLPFRSTLFLTLAVAVVSVVHRLHNREPLAKNHTWGIGPALILFWGWSTAYASYYATSATIDELVLWAQGIVLFYLVTTQATSENRLRTLLRVFLLGAMGISLLSLYQAATGTTSLFGLYRPWAVADHNQQLSMFGSSLRVNATFGAPNYLGAYASLVIAMGASFAMWSTSRMDRWIGIIGGGLGAIMSAVTYTRGAWIGAAAALAVLSLYAFRRSFKRTLVLVTLLGVVAIGIVAVRSGPSDGSLAERLGTMFQYDYSSNVERIVLWSFAWQSGQLTPWSGKGLGSFPVLYAAAKPVSYPVRFHAHDTFLQLFFELGIPGVVLHLGAVMAVIGGAAIGFLRYPTHTAAPVLVGLTAGLASYIAHGLVDWLIVDPQISALVFVWLGLTIANVRLVYEKEVKTSAYPVSFTGDT